MGGCDGGEDLMGDMADYYLDRAFEEEYDSPDEDYLPSVLTCKFCHKSGFHWEKIKGNWRICTRTGRIHHCRKGKAWLVRSEAMEGKDD